MRNFDYSLNLKELKISLNLNSIIFLPTGQWIMDPPPLPPNQPSPKRILKTVGCMTR